MSAVEKRLALKKLLVLIALQKDVFKGKSKTIGKDFGSDGHFDEQNEKGQFFKNLLG